MANLRRSPAVRAAALAVGLALVGVAVWFALRNIDLDRLRQAEPWHIAALAGLVALTLLNTAAVFWAVTLSYDARPRVGLMRMTELICASSLLNYLPLRAGLFGRAAYLKLRHALPVGQSVQIVLVVVALTVVTTVLAAALPLFEGGAARLGWAIASVVALSLATRPLARLVLRRPTVHAWTWLPLRAVELVIATARLWLALRIVGQPVAFWQVAVAAAAGFLINLIGLTPNGLGLREWAVAALTELLAPTTGPAAALAAVIDRGVEAIVFTIAGLLSMDRLRRAERRATPPAGKPG